MHSGVNLHNLVNIESPKNQENTLHDTEPLHLALLNARSINNKSLFIKDYVVENRIDIMALTETWLKSDSESTSTISDLCPQGYAFYHVPRSNRSGGGVGLLYNKCLRMEKQNVTVFSSFELIEVLLHSSTAVVRIAVIYRPPPSSANGLTPAMFFKDFSDLLGRFAVSTGKLLILGDFNFHVNDSSSDRLAASFMDLLNSYNLIQHVSEPTHINNHTLDLIITRANEQVVLDCSVQDADLSDHYVIHSNMSLAKPRTPRVEKLYRKLRAVDIEAFRSDLLKSALFTSPASNHNDLCDQYHSELLHLVDSHAPLRKRLVISRPAAPWYTNAIASEKCKRRKLERRWRKSQLTIDHQLYADQCKLVNNLIKSSKMNHYSTLISEHKSDQKFLFTTIDRLLHRKPEKLYPSCDSTTDLCNKFADFFSDKIVAIRDLLDSVPDEDVNYLDNLDVVHPNCELVSFTPTTEVELSDLIESSAAKSCRLDPIPATLLRGCFSDLVPIITRIVNSSFESCQMPTSMKLAVLSPLLKKPSLDFELFPNFRPVSNLRFLSKATEKVVAVRLKNYLRDNDLDETLQSAYKERHSCETALLRVQNDVLRAIDGNRCVVLLLLDLSAAFDTVDHDILLERLSSKFGIRGDALAWFKSYLADRTQYVKIDDASSSVRPLDCGVPQGSVLGPMLYLLYTSPLGDIIRKHGMSFHLYADDTQIYTTFHYNDDQELATVKRIIEHCLQDIDMWLTRNKLKLKKDKTELLLLHSRFRQHIQLPCLTLGTDIIYPSDRARNIGVMFDSTMTMSYQVNCIVKSCFYHLRNIAQIRKFLSLDTTKILVHAFVSSKLDYCNSLLYGLPKHEITKLQNVQNAAARVIACLRKYDHISATLKELHWLPVEQRIIFKINLITFKALHNLAPKYLQELLVIYRPRRQLRSSNAVLRLTNYVFNLKTYGYRAFSIAAPELWNVLPQHVRSSDNVNILKSRLKTHLFKAVYNL